MSFGLEADRVAGPLQLLVGSSRQRGQAVLPIDTDSTGYGFCRCWGVGVYQADLLEEPVAGDAV